jgi:predicted DNA-binding transcriptional regulator YafY
MASTTPENDKIEISVGHTPKGGELVITTTKTGLYKIEYRGTGAPPKVTDQLFTSLLLAKRAMENWRRANAAQYAKEDLKNKIATSPSIKEQRKIEAMKLKNGALETPEEDDEE